MPRTPSSARGATILGWGTNLPEKVLTNHDLEKMVETSHDWIVERSGIHQRHVGGSTIPMAIAAGRMAIERSGIEPSKIDALILATTTPDKQWGNSAAVQDALGLRCGVFELNSACSGFVYGLVAAHGMIAVGLDNVLVIASWVFIWEAVSAFAFGRRELASRDRRLVRLEQAPVAFRAADGPRPG